MFSARSKKVVSIQQLVEADLRDELSSSMGSALLAMNLWSTAEAAREKMLPRNTQTEEYRKRKKTVKRYEVAFNALKRKGREWLGDHATVGDLAGVNWEHLWEVWDAGPTDWMHMKEAVSRTLTVALGDKWHPFARQIRTAIPSKKVTKRRPNLTFKKFQSIVSHAPEHAAPSYWTLALTGMRVSEYLRCRREHLIAETRTLNVPGSKTDGSDAPQQIDPRIWKIVAAGIPSRLQYKWLNIYWNRAREKAGAPTVTMHDLRHSAGQWAVDQGAAESKVQSFLRHETAGVTRDYVIRSETGEVSAALANLLDKKPQNRRKKA